MKNSRTYRAIGLGLLCVAITGCSSMSPVQKGAVIAGGVGAGVGAIWSANHNHPIVCPWEAAGIGALAGAATGALIGDSLNEYSDENAADYREREALLNELQAQLAEKDQELALLRNQPGMENVQVEAVNGQLRFTILNEVLFQAGKTDLMPASKQTLDQVLTMIQQEYADRNIMIEGHCDTDPITRSKWRDNWELSYNRSMSVLYYYQNEKGVSPERLTSLACGAYQPVAPNNSTANKRQNRRAVIVVMPPEGLDQVALR